MGVLAKQSQESLEAYARRAIEAYNLLPLVSRRGKPRRPCKYAEIEGAIRIRCHKCDEYKSPDDFNSVKDKLYTACKVCSRQGSTSRYDKKRNQEKPKRKVGHYQEIEGILHRNCLRCEKVMPVSDFNRQNGHYASRCRICINSDPRIKEKEKEFRARNADRLRASKKAYTAATVERRREYRKKNKEKILKAASARHKKRLESDIGYRIRCLLVSRFSKSVSNFKDSKTKTSHRLLGCSFEDFCIYIESLFLPGMTWDNHGRWKVGQPMTWQIDHIKPCAAFDLTNEKERARCFHYTNMQPLWAIDNARKNHRLNWESIT